MKEVKEKINTTKFVGKNKKSKLLKFLFTSITLAGVALVTKNAIEKINLKKRFRIYKLLKN